MQSNRHMRKSAPLGGRLTKPCLGPGVGEDVDLLGNTDICGHRNEGNPRDQAAGDGEHGRRGWGGQHGDPLRTADPLSHRCRRTDQIAAGKGDSPDPDRIADIGPGRHCSGVQRGQQHPARLPRPSGESCCRCDG